MDKLEQFIIARYMYRIGEDFISDWEYDELLDKITNNKALEDYTSRTYDDDYIPVELLEKYNMSEYITNSLQSERDISFLAEDKSMSIRKIDNMEDVFYFCQAFRNQELCLSIKMDGDNIKSEILNSELLLSLTRGRASMGIDVTESMLQIIPKDMNLDGHRVVTGEVFVPEEHLEYLRNKYDVTKYKTTRTSAMTMLRRPQDHDLEDLNKMEFVTFSCDGLADTVSETYEALRDVGFSIAPYLVLSDIPDNLADFTVYFEELMDTMYHEQEQRGLPADGLVLEVNNYHINSEIKDQYDSRQIAVKFGHWASTVYTGVIKKIIIEQRRVYCCCKVEIEPLKTNDGCLATTINIFNPSFLLDKKLGVGDKIKFERQSGTVNVLVND